MDAFATLQLPRKAALSEEEVRAAFFAASKQPDADQLALNAAFEQLLTPENRLKHLIELDAPADAKQWRTVTMPEDMMDIFMAFGRLRPDAEALIAKRAAAQSALSKALLEPQTYALRDSLEQIGHALHEKRTALEQSLGDFNGEDTASWRTVCEAQSRFAYLAKWQTQVRELLMKLM